MVLVLGDVNDPQRVKLVVVEGYWAAIVAWIGDVVFCEIAMLAPRGSAPTLDLSERARHPKLKMNMPFYSTYVRSILHSSFNK